MSTRHDPGRDDGPPGATAVTAGAARPTTPAHPDDEYTTWQEVQASEDFQALRRAFRRFVFPMTVAFLAWYFTYVLLAAYATEFFAQPVIGNVNVGILFGLGQFLSTALITMAYVRWTNRNLDDQAERIASHVRLDGEVR